jgi:hypothetical protein
MFRYIVLQIVPRIVPQIVPRSVPRSPSDRPSESFRSSLGLSLRSSLGTSLRASLGSSLGSSFGLTFPWRFSFEPHFPPSSGHLPWDPDRLFRWFCCQTRRPTWPSPLLGMSSAAATLVSDEGLMADDPSPLIGRGGHFGIAPHRPQRNQLANCSRLSWTRQ